jgi:hypothetical protein
MTRLLREPLLLRASTIAIAAVLVSMPISIGSDLSAPAWKSALAGQGGNGGGDGGGNGGGNGAGNGGGNGGGNGAGNHGGNHGSGGRGHANGHDKDGSGHGRGDAEYDSFGAWVDDVRTGNAFGHDRQDEHVEKAKERYQTAVSKDRGHKADIDKNHEVAHSFSPHETKELIERGWRARTTDAGFRNHGQRVSTMVELAKRLGYGARVGAMQANFGTPFENGIAELQAELAEAREAAAANPDDAAAQQRVEDLNAELAEAIAAAKPGKGPDDSWATADLDVNDDGVVDPQDLAALDAGASPDEASDADDTPAS